MHNLMSEMGIYSADRQKEGTDWESLQLYVGSDTFG